MRRAVRPRPPREGRSRGAVRLLQRLAAVAAMLCMVAASCTTEEPIEVRAVFDDVADLVPNAAVKVADVPVGRVSEIMLTEDMRAEVVMEVESDTPLPGRLQANLRKTSVLGERYIQLEPIGEAGSFTSGNFVESTDVVPELEEVIQTSTDLLIAVSTDTLADAIASSAEGMDGRGQTLGQIIDDLNAVVSTYDANSADLVRLLDGFDQFLDTVGPQALVHGRALTEIAAFTEVLAEEDDRLIDALVTLQDLSVTGTDIMVTHAQRIDDFVFRLDGITDELASEQTLAAFDTILGHVAQHNFSTIRGVNNEHAQVVLDFISCGVNDIPGDPVRGCDDPPQGRPRPELRPPQDY